MPLISPLDIQVALGPVLAGIPARTGKSATLKQKLEAAGLSEVDIFDTIRQVMSGGETASARLQAAKAAAELHGLLESENVKPIPIVNIIINDGNTNNPILIPREMQSCEDL